MATLDFIRLDTHPNYLRKVFKLNLREEAQIDDPRYFEEIKRTLCDCTTTSTLPLCLVATRDHRAVGLVILCASAIKTYCYLRPWVDSLWVEKSMRGSGLGGALLERISWHARDLGYKQIFTGVRAELDLDAKLEGLHWEKLYTTYYYRTQINIYRRSIESISSDAPPPTIQASEREVTYVSSKLKKL